ncbi:transposase [Nitrosomonas sp. Nm166]|uniref:transposase n=1 Tax=Nitrosomonas sp. Nm166 TaxID=1881054 RepID=UPI00352375F0
MQKLKTNVSCSQLRANNRFKRDTPTADSAVWDKRPRPEKQKRFGPGNFRLAEDGSHCLCPAGKRLYSNGSNCTFNDYAAMKFRGAERDYLPCTLRAQCLCTPEETKTRQVAFFQGKRDGYETHTDRMKRKIDSDRGQQIITRRFATVEPVFGNLRNNKRLDFGLLCGVGAKSTDNGSCTVWSTTLRSLSIMGWANEKQWIKDKIRRSSF